METIKVLLVDDHEDSMEIMEYFIGNLPSFQVIGKCTNGEEIIDHVMEKSPDLVISDINMPKKSGMEAIKECMTFYPKLKFIFVTGYEEYAVEAFQLAAIDYIVKPLEKIRFYKALERARELFIFEKENPSEQNFKLNNLPIKGVNCTYYIPLSEIYFIEKSGYKCLVYTKEKVYETSECLSSLNHKMDSTFFLSHRSFLINLKKVAQIIPHKETFIAYFHDIDMQASVSKLKIK